jgi:hypothetical protein
LYGYQNKKTSLDFYYQLFEETFEDEESLRSLFRSVLSELDKVLPNLRATRWKKKSDFYTLFLVFANHRQSIPLSSEKRRRRRKL